MDVLSKAEATCQCMFLFLPYALCPVFCSFYEFVLWISMFVSICFRPIKLQSHSMEKRDEWTPWRAIEKRRCHSGESIHIRQGVKRDGRWHFITPKASRSGRKSVLGLTKRKTKWCKIKCVFSKTSTHLTALACNSTPTVSTSLSSLFLTLTHRFHLISQRYRKGPTTPNSKNDRTVIPSQRLRIWRLFDVTLFTTWRWEASHSHIYSFSSRVQNPTTSPRGLQSHLRSFFFFFRNVELILWHSSFASLPLHTRE